MKQKLCFITNIGPHYRLPIFQKISETFSCDFYLGDHINTKIKAIKKPCTIVSFITFIGKVALYN